MAEPTAVKLSVDIDELLSRLDDELHGLRGAFSEAQKIRRLNKSVNLMWKVLKNLNENYFVAESQRTGADTDEDFFGDLSTTSREYNLPRNYAEMRTVEVTGPSSHLGVRFERLAMNTQLWRDERAESNDAGSGSQEPGTVAFFHYDIYGPNKTGRWQFVLSRFPPAALQMKLRYVRRLPNFSVPKVAGETLAGILEPYIDDLVTYAAKSLAKSESSEQGANYERELRQDLEKTASAADEIGSADREVAEAFWGE